MQAAGKSTLAGQAGVVPESHTVLLVLKKETTKR